MNLDIPTENIKNVYYMPEDAPKYVLLVKANDGRYKTWETDTTLSGIIAKVIIGFKEKKAQFLQKILDLVQ
jgi:hypothetical protein